MSFEEAENFLKEMTTETYKNYMLAQSAIHSPAWMTCLSKLEEPPLLFFAPSQTVAEKQESRLLFADKDGFYMFAAGSQVAIRFLRRTIDRTPEPGHTKIKEAVVAIDPRIVTKDV